MSGSDQMQHWLLEMKSDRICELQPCDKPKSEESPQWVVEAKLDVLSALRVYNKSVCIFSAPKELLKESEDAYVPRIVSIGPYHFGKEGLKEMERFKGEATRRELERIQSKIGNSDFSFEELLSKVDNMLGKICRCYDKDIPNHFKEKCDNHYALSWMMVRDACFILEFFRCTFKKDELFKEDGDFQILQRFHPIFGSMSSPVVKSDIMKDLIKLENQIPLFVLEEVLATEEVLSTEEEAVAREEALVSMEETVDIERIKKEAQLKKAHCKLQKLLRAVFAKFYYRPFEYCHVGKSRRLQSHILDIYHYFCLGDEDPREENVNPEEESTDSNDLEVESRRSKFPSAVELKKAGVKIQPTGRVIEDISFEGRTLSIPPIKLDVDSEIFVRNLIALEICSPYGPSKRMTAFVQFMNELCQTERGAAVMRKNGVIVGNLGQHSEVARFFSSCKQSRLVRSCDPIQKTRTKLIEHSTRNYRIIWNGLWNAYLKPWLVIGGIGATIVLLLTAVQVMCLFISCKAP